MGPFWPWSKSKGTGICLFFHGEPEGSTKKIQNMRLAGGGLFFMMLNNLSVSLLFFSFLSSEGGGAPNGAPGWGG